SRRAGCWLLRPQSSASTALLPPPALGERRHRGLARRLVDTAAHGPSASTLAGQLFGGREPFGPRGVPARRPCYCDIAMPLLLLPKKLQRQLWRPCLCRKTFKRCKLA